MNSKAESRYQLSTLALKQNKLEDALRYASEATGFDSSKCKYYCQRVQCLVLLKKYNEALADCKSVRILDPKYAEILPWEFQCHVKVGDLTTAKTVLDKLERLKSGHEKLESMTSKYNELTELERQVRESANKNDLESVKEIVDKLVQECNGSKKMIALHVELLISSKQFDKAREIYEAELDGYLNDPDILYVSASLSFNRGDISSCNFACQALFRLAPDFGEKGKSLYTKVRALTPLVAEGGQAFKDKDYEKAKTIYTEAIKLSSDCDALRERFLVNRAVVNTKLENFQEVVGDCTDVIELNDKNAKAFFNRAEGYVGLKKFDKAKSDFEQTYAMDKSERTKKRVEEAAEKAKFDFRLFLDGLDNENDQPSAATREFPQQQTQKKPLDQKKLQEFRDTRAKMLAAGDDFRAVLGIKKGEDLNLSKQTINRLKKKYHPDAYDAYPEMKAECNEIFKMILKASSTFGQK